MASLRIFVCSIFFVTLLVSDWNIQILYLRKFLTENMKWILKKKNQQIHLQVNRNKMFWVFSFVPCFKASGNLSRLVFLCPLFVHEPNRHRGWGLYSAETRLPKAMERLSEDVAVWKSATPYQVVPFVFSIWWDLPHARIIVWHSCRAKTVNSQGRNLRPETKYLQSSLQEKRLRSQKFS